MHPRGVYSGFQVTGMIKGIFGFDIIISRIFGGIKIWQLQYLFRSLIDLSRDFMGDSKQSEDLW